MPSIHDGTRMTGPGTMLASERCAPRTIERSFAELTLSAAPGAPSSQRDTLPTVTPVGRRCLPGVSHYLQCPDPQDQQRSVPHFGQVLLPDVRPGVDLVFHGKAGELEYDLVLEPGLEPQSVVEARH